MIPGSSNPLMMATAPAAPAAGAVQIERSLRFNSSDSAYLSRTPAVAGNRRIFTWAGWIKRSKLSTSQNIFGAPLAGGYPNSNLLITNDNLRFNDTGPGGDMVTTAVYRDTSAWMHVVLAVNYTILQAKMYVNGAEITSFSVNNPFSNTDSVINASGVVHTIGQNSVALYLDAYLADIHFIDGQALTPAAFTEVSATTGQLIPKAYAGTYTGNSFWLKFNDNSAATATTLGKDSFLLGNNWTPNNLSVTAGAGNDSLVDTPTSYGTDTYVGGEVRGNYATLNPLSAIAHGPGTFSEGNLQLVTLAGAGAYSPTRGTIAVSNGKWYWECVCTNSTPVLLGIGDISEALPAVPGESAKSYGYDSSGTKRNNAVVSSYGATYGANDVIGVAMDLEAGTVVFYKNNTSQGTAFSGLSGTFTPFIADVNSTLSATIVCNFGQRAFAYTAPSGFKALCDTNLPAPLVALPNTVMDVKLYQGNASTQTISGLGFSPDLVWIKGRSLAYNHRLIDSVRGVQKFLLSNLTNGEITSTTNDRFTSFDATGFTLGAADQPSGDGLNQSGGTYVAWAWDAGANSSKTYTVTVASAGGANRYFIDGVQQATINLEEGSTYIFDQSAASNSSHPLRFSTTSNGTHSGGTEYTTGVTTVGTPGNAGAYTQIAVASSAPALYYYCTNHSGMGGAINTNTTAGASNFVGSITSQVRANVSAGFSVVTYTGVAGNQSFGHGLGVKPKLIMIKNRSNSANWFVMFDLGTTYYKYGHLNTTDQFYDATAQPVTSTTITYGSNNAWFGAVGDNYVAYCFAPVAGYSNFGSWVGSGTTNDGAFIYTGFRPRFILLKNSDNVEQWYIYDSARRTYNVQYPDPTELRPNSAGAEGSASLAVTLDFLSNGFKIRGNTGAEISFVGRNYIYAAFAESPFQYARAR